jgi:hypothetical protein
MRLPTLLTIAFAAVATAHPPVSHPHRNPPDTAASEIEDLHGAQPDEKPLHTTVLMARPLPTTVLMAGYNGGNNVELRRRR